MIRGRSSLIQLAFALCVAIAAVELFAIGCNGVLGNEPGSLAQDGAAGGVTCAADQKVCAQTCVSTDQPQAGCGGECSVCPTPANAQSICQLQNNVQTCALGNCNAQFGDCDNDASDGCETHTTTVLHCGKCGTQCNQEPYCEPSSSGGSDYTCSQTCDFHVCPNGTDAGACVDLTSDNQSCGACGKSCAIQNGTGKCEDGGCAITCTPGFFLCNGQCTGVTVNSCGATCGPCSNGSVCDLVSGSNSYGTCVAPGGGGSDAGGGGGGGATCSTSNDCTGGKTCCGSVCTDQDDTHCGLSCTNCAGSLGAGATCTQGVCQATCTAPYNCGTSPSCGCMAGLTCNLSPDFSKDNNCGDCATNCGFLINKCCCATSQVVVDGGGGEAYTCSGTKAGDFGCNCTN